MNLGPLEIILITSTLLELNPLFQTAKIIKLKQSKDVSLWTYLMILFIGTLWFFYGLSIKSLPLIMGNGIKLVCSLSVVVAYLIYKNKAGEIQ